jgi:anti-sigma regulatory factor (Ser/Thr protein kinase)
MTMDLELRFPPSARAPAAARKSLSRLGEVLEPEVFENVRLLVSELVTNSVRHGGLGLRDEVKVRVAADRETVTVEITDPGEGFRSGRDAPNNDPTAGWGLYLVDRIADRWGIADDGFTKVWFELRRPPVRGGGFG